MFHSFKRLIQQFVYQAMTRIGFRLGLYQDFNQVHLSSRVIPQTMLRPVNLVVVYVSLFIALLLNLLPWGSNALWMPDWVALVLMFWVSKEPRLLGFGVAFILGLLMDVHDAVLLGQYALGYVVLTFSATLLSKRLPSFNLKQQMFHIIPVLIMAKVLTFMLKSFFGGTFSGWTAMLISPVLAGLLWPLISWLLLIPQRRPIDVDMNRPL